MALWTLPRTDYSHDLSDDCYHLGEGKLSAFSFLTRFCGVVGISVEVEHKDFGLFKHQIPTGPIVLVSKITPTPAGKCAISPSKAFCAFEDLKKKRTFLSLYPETMRFLSFLRSVTEMVEKISGVLLPEYVKLRWEGRTKGALSRAFFRFFFFGISH